MEPINWTYLVPSRSWAELRPWVKISDLPEMHRKYQGKFRRELLERYGKGQITGRGALICEACHIVPFSRVEEEGKYSADNGLLLCRDLHKLHDEYLLSIEPEKHQVILSQVILEDPEFSDYHGIHEEILEIPKSSDRYLAWHYQEYLTREQRRS